MSETIKYDSREQAGAYGTNPDGPDAKTVKDWYAIYTIVKHEKAVNSSLVKRGVETFLPFIETVNQWKDRKKLIQLPLFPGYLFASLRPHDSHTVFQILNTRGVVRILSSNGRLCPVPAEQIDAVKNLLKTKIKSDPYPYFVRDSEVVVRKGPLQGITGRIVGWKGDSRLIISIDIIKRSIAVKVDPEDVEPV